jgi:hypothetical protein
MAKVGFELRLRLRIELHLTGRGFNQQAPSRRRERQPN